MRKIVREPLLYGPLARYVEADGRHFNSRLVSLYRQLFLATDTIEIKYYSSHGIINSNSLNNIDKTEYKHRYAVVLV